jgi:putative resolvase
VIIHNEAQPVTFEEELCKDVITLMTVFSARLYGKRSHTNKQFAAAA